MNISLAVGIWLVLLGVVYSVKEGSGAGDPPARDAPLPFYKYVWRHLIECAVTTQIVRGFSASRKARAMVFWGVFLTVLGILAEYFRWI